MVGPLVVLAVFSVIVGWGTVVRHPQSRSARRSWSRCSTTASRTEPSTRNVCMHLHYYRAGVLARDRAGRASGWACSITPRPASAYFVPTRLSAARTAERFGGVYRFLVHKWYFDELYGAVLVRPCLAFARLCREIDRILIDGLVNGAATVTAFLSRLEGIFDMIAVDGWST